jgi:heavy metal sensor kinase
VPAFARTIRFRLAAWYSSLLLVFGVAFIVALNVAARLDRAEVQFYYNGVPVDLYELRIVPDRPGAAVGGEVPVMNPGLLVRAAEQQAIDRSLERLQTWSIIAVVGLAIASGIGGYVLSGMMLRPVRDITEVASEISATSLSRRINHQGPADELKALADTFDSMIGRLESSFERQRQFVQDASHELRTPLTAIRTNIEVAEMEAGLAPEYRELLATIKRQTDRLTRLTEDLLLLTSQEGGQVETEPEDVTAIARAVVRELGPLAAARGTRLSLEAAGPVEALAHADLLYRCVSNLVDNAIKYSGEGATVTVAISEERDAIRVAVQDNGPGISPEDAPRLFDRFYRVDRARSRREGGNGLGLAIVKELVEAQGGRVELHSAPGFGATFTLLLRAAPRWPSTPEPARAPSAGAVAWRQAE